MSIVLENLAKIGIPENLLPKFANEGLPLTEEDILAVQYVWEGKTINVLKQKLDAENAAKVEAEKQLGIQKLKELSEKFDNSIHTKFAPKLKEKAKRAKGESDEAYIERIFQEMELASTPSDSHEAQTKLFSLQKEYDAFKNEVPAKISEALKQKENEFSKEKAKTLIKAKVKSLGLIGNDAEDFIFHLFEKSMQENGYDFRLDNDKVGYISKDGKIPTKKLNEIETNEELTPDFMLEKLVAKYPALKPISNGARIENLPLANDASSVTKPKGIVSMWGN